MIRDAETLDVRAGRGVFSTSRPLGAGRIAVVAATASETNLDIADAWRALGLDAEVMTPGRCLERLRPGDIALGRLDVRRTLDGVEPGLLGLLALRRRGIRVLNSPAALPTCSRSRSATRATAIP